VKTPKWYGAVPLITIDEFTALRWRPQKVALEMPMFIRKNNKSEKCKNCKYRSVAVPHIYNRESGKVGSGVCAGRLQRLYLTVPAAH
jgi:hypothetical protein